MKKLILIIACGGLFFACCGKKDCSQKCQTTTCKKEQVVDDHSSKNPLDWEGEYAGTLPCADCSGIKVNILLNTDGTFEKSEEYLEKESEVVESKGTFSWDKTGGIITLKDEKGRKTHYRVGEGRLIMLQNEKTEVTGELANDYILSKVEVIK